MARGVGGLEEVSEAGCGAGGAPGVDRFIQGSTMFPNAKSSWPTPSPPSLAADLPAARWIVSQLPVSHRNEWGRCNFELGISEMTLLRQKGNRDRICLNRQLSLIPMRIRRTNR